MYKFIIKTFDQLKKDNFDQVKFDQVIIPPDDSHLKPQSYNIYKGRLGLNMIFFTAKKNIKSKTTTIALAQIIL